MARVWIYDRSNTKRYKDAVQKAKLARREPPGRWMVQYYDLAGDLRSEVFSTKTPAETRRSTLESALLSGSYVDPAKSRVPLETVAETWLSSRNGLRPSTWWKYRGLLDNHVLPRWGEVPLNAISKEDIGAWVGKLVRPSSEGGSSLGASQARHAYRVLSMILIWCVPDRLPQNPAKDVELPIPPELEHIYLTYRQVEALATAAGTLTTKYGRPTAHADINRAFILLLAYTGLRLGEAAALRIKNVNLESRRIRVVSTFTEAKGGLREGPPKSGKKRTVALPTSLVPILRDVIGDRPEDELLFTTGRGQPVRANNWRLREFVPAVEAAKLKVQGLTPHKLRHTAASLAIAAGADVKVVQLMLGHADASMTLNVYGHLWPDRLDEVADVLDIRRTAALGEEDRAA
ncbi:MAG: site-specific integrase [Actinomycetota bacterium]|nr:site-specific integrase [Actinomycetota bacterium]